MCSPSDRRGISLLEVLIAMFVLAVGILSILALFTAGRELESRAAIKSSAVAFAAAQQDTIANQWLDFEQWLCVDNPATPSFRWAKPEPGGPVPEITLPVLVDPWGLCTGGKVRETATVWDPAHGTAVIWDWSRFVPLASDGPTAPFQRVTLPARERQIIGDPPIAPFNREEALASFSDQDSIEYSLSANADDPPLNAFEVGRRKRGSDFVPAVFIAAVAPASNQVTSGTPVKRSLLIFHKPVPDFETNDTAAWPAGMIELRLTSHAKGLITAVIWKTPAPDDTAVRRSLKPGKWMLFTSRLPRAGGPYRYATEWREATSVTKGEGGEWLIVLKTDLPDDWPVTPEASVDGPISKWNPQYPGLAPPTPQIFSPIYCYAFEHLVHVVTDLDVTTLP